MADFLDPKNDLTFKRVFGEHKHLCMSLINNNENTKEIPEELLQHDYIRETLGYMERAAYTKEQLDAYYQWKLDTLAGRVMIENAEARGEAKGRIEEQEKKVVNGFKAGHSKDLIATFTGLTPEQVTEILKQHGLV